MKLNSNSIRVGAICLSILIVVFLVFFIRTVTADIQTLPTQAVESCVNLPQTCSSCSFVNLSSVKLPNSVLLVYNQAMTKQGVNFNYTFCNTTQFGQYIVTTCGDKDGTFQCANYNFTITTTGKTLALQDIVIYIVFLIFCLTVTVFSIRMLRNHSYSSDKLSRSEKYKMKKTHEFTFYLTLLKNKLWMVGVFGIYLSLLMFSTVLNQLVYDMQLVNLYVILGMFNKAALWGLVPFVIFWIGYLIIYFYTQTKDILAYEFGGFRT